MIDFGREICSDLDAATRREWLVTNGIGGFASGTIAGVLTRRYHGLLVAARKPPVARTLLLAKLDEFIDYDGEAYPLFCDRWTSGDVQPDGYHYLERFHLEGTTPVWTYACADARLEKRVWIQAGENTTYVMYRNIHPLHFNADSTAHPMRVTLNALTNFRNYHGITQPPDRPQLNILPSTHGFDMATQDQVNVLYVRCDHATFAPAGAWRSRYFYAEEAYRGETASEDHFIAGTFHAVLQPGESLTLVASTEADPAIESETAYRAQKALEHRLLEQAGLNVEDDESRHNVFPVPKPDGAIRQLVLAASQFIVSRASAREPQGYTVIAGYPWFTDWGRDTMISLPGLTLATGRPEVARRVLRTFADSVDQGMIPNRFPDAGEAPEYNTVDATLWFFEATRAYYDLTGDDNLLDEMFPILAGIVDWHQRGTRYQIRVDPQDGLLYAGEPGVQLTWMDAKVDDWVVTPRIGKPVEVNALWFNALHILAGFARRLGKPAAPYLEAAEQARIGFDRFWNPSTRTCFDVLDGPQGDDPALRPNQIFAVSLPYSPLSALRQRQVVDACQRYLLASLGLRSLGPSEPGYTGQYGGDRRTRDASYHQGTTWGWLIAPFILAHLRVHNNPQQALSFLQPFYHHLFDHGLGSVSEIFDGDPPFTPRGCFAQAWSVAAILQILHHMKVIQPGGNHDKTA